MSGEMSEKVVNAPKLLSDLTKIGAGLRRRVCVWGGGGGV